MKTQEFKIQMCLVSNGRTSTMNEQNEQVKDQWNIAGRTRENETVWTSHSIQFNLPLLAIGRHCHT